MIYTYQDIIKNKRKLDHCGGKGKNLFLLKSHGISVPEFAVIPFHTLSKELEGLNMYIQAQLAKIKTGNDESLMKIAREIQVSICSLTLSAAFKNKLSNILKTNFGESFSIAIRSSAALEDGHMDSFAGMFDSYLFVKEENILNKIKGCIASNFNARLLKYKLLRKIDLEEFNFAIILQKMVDSSKAGVIFTMNPEGNLNDLLICAAYGQGEGVVQGTADTESYYIDRNSEEVSVVRPSNKKPINECKKTHFSSNSQGREKVLSQEELSQLFRTAKSIEALFGRPQDIEFAVDEIDNIVYLQSRDITTIQFDDLKILDNSNIVESYPGISLPLTFSLALSAYHRTMVSAAKFFKMSAKDLKDCKKLFPELIAHVNGRIYYNLHHWYSIVQKTMISEKGLKSWENFIGVSKREKRMKKFSFFKKIRRLLHLVDLYIRHQKSCNQFFSNFDREYSEFRAFITEASEKNYSGNKIYSFYQQISTRMFSFWGITLINDIFVYRFFEHLKNLVSSFNIPESGNLANDLLCGIEGVESEKPIIKLLELKSQINKDQKLCQLFEADPKFILHKLKEEKDFSFTLNFFEYIEQYGDRTLAELKLESPNFRSHPEHLIRLLQNYLSNTLDKDTFKEKQYQIKLRAEDIIKSHQSRLSPKTWWFKYVLRETKKFIKNRENMRFARTRAYSLTKELFLQIGKIMVQKGIIEKKEDIYFLQLEDLKTFCLEGTQKKWSYEIEKRKSKYSSYMEMSLPDKIMYTGKNIPHLLDSANLYREQKNCLKGIAISKGDVEGEALVLDHPDYGCQIDNKILVTKTTDPGWIFLMAQAKGIISEKGSPLSHTAIVGRELGIPTIVNVEGATSNIKNGVKIHMHAQTGIVEILN